MALVANRNGNVWFIESTSSGYPLTLDSATNLRITHVIVTPTAANAHFELGDLTTGNSMFQAKVSGAGDTQQFTFELNPLYFPTGLKLIDCTNCDTMLVIHPGGQH